MIFRKATTIAVATVIAGAALTAVQMTSLHADCPVYERLETLQLELVDVSINGESIDLPADRSDEDYLAVATQMATTDGRNYFRMTLYDQHTGESQSADLKPYDEGLPAELEAYLSDGE